MSTAEILLPALTGGLAGALITLGAQSFFRYWNRPILGILFQKNEDGCDVSTQGWIVDYQGNPITDTQGNRRNVRQHYLRLKVTNRGKTFAKNVSVCVTQRVGRISAA